MIAPKQPPLKRQPPTVPRALVPSWHYHFLPPRNISHSLVSSRTMPRLYCPAVSRSCCNSCNLSYCPVVSRSRCSLFIPYRSGTIIGLSLCPDLLTPVQPPFTRQSPTAPRTLVPSCWSCPFVLTRNLSHCPVVSRSCCSLCFPYRFT